MAESDKGDRSEALRFELPFRSVGDRQVVFFDAEQILERVADATVITVASVGEPAARTDFFELGDQALLGKERLIRLHTLVRGDVDAR